MVRTVVGVLRGGPSSEYALSLKTGAALLQALPEDRYDTRDIFIDKTGMWHARGMPATPSRALDQVDVVLNGLHGGVGEDGTVQRILDRLGIPYAGSRAYQSGVSLHKMRAREVLKKAGIRMPQARSFVAEEGITTADMARIVFAQFAPPYVVKPVDEGASYGIVLANSIIELPDVLGDVLDVFGAAIIEEYIRGDEATVGIIENFRNEELYALPPVHVSYDGSRRHIPHTAHLDGSVRYAVPANFSYEHKEMLADMARAAHQALELSHYSRADMILTPRGPYLLEVNALPGLHDTAPFPQMLNSVGSSVGEFAQHIVDLARKTK